MKILIITPTYPRHMGGCAKSVKLLRDNLLSLDCDVTVLVINNSKFNKEVGVEYLCADSRHIFSIPKILVSIRKKARGYDIVHVYNVFLLPFVKIAVLGMNTKIVATLNNLNWGCLNPNFQSLNQCQTCTAFDRQVCSSTTRNMLFTMVSPIIKYSDHFFVFSNVFKSIYGFRGINKNKITLIQNFVPDFSDVKRAKRDKSTLRISYIGSIDERKGASLFAHAISLLSPLDMEKLRIGVYGEGKPNLTAQFDRFDNVRVKKLTPDSRDFFEVLRNTDVLVHPAICNDSFPRVWMEASAFGCALLLSDIDTANELVGPYAKYFQKNNASSLADNISEFANSTSMISEYKMLSKAWFKTLRSNDSVVREILKCYDAL